MAETTSASKVFNLRIVVSDSEGASDDDIYHRLCNKLYEIDDVTEVSEIATQEIR